VDELSVLQAVRLKGRVNLIDLASTTVEELATVESAVADLTGSGLLAENKERFKLTPDGRTRLAELLAAERDGTDEAVLSAAYADFRVVNADFKQTVSDWQIKDGETNVHDDADYDAALLARLDDIHARVVPVVAAVGTQIPRLTGYSDKLATALSRTKAGEPEWLIRPIIDSYHTVWFELHEELIAAVGLTREDEAKAGHA
jgi:hypothetical protein